MIPSIAARNAASVFPDPVGARISVDAPEAIAGQPSCCGRVGASKDAANQSRTGAWKLESSAGVVVTVSGYRALTRAPVLGGTRAFALPGVGPLCGGNPRHRRARRRASRPTGPL